MKVESKIKEILEESGSAEHKIEVITSFMNWDADKLADAINRYGTSSSEGRTSIIEQFWGKSKSKNERRSQ